MGVNLCPMPYDNLRKVKMNIAEILFVVALLIPLIPMAIARQWWLVKVFGIFYVCFGLVEWWAVSSSGMSVSQHFWEFSQDSPTQAIVILATMGIMWAFLLAHLGAKLFKKR